MKLLITGAAGMIGAKLSQRIAAEGSVHGQPVESITLFDVVPTTAPPSDSIDFHIETGDLRSSATTDSLAAARPDLIFHLAAIVSGEAELDFEKGYGINLDGTRNLLDAIRAVGTQPRFVFASSIAVFGAPFPAAIPDEFFNTPLTSYGTQKTIGELLISDYSRRGILDGLSLRLPTICVRPGSPNKAASGFFSNIMREPLNGQEAVLPVSEEVKHWFASPRAAINFLLHAATLDTARAGNRRAITMPGIAATVGEQIDALRQIAGEEVVARIRREPDDFIQSVVAGWPQQFDARRALELGFRPDTDFAEIIRIHIEDELNGEIK